jgi:hypothetical protein
MAAISFDLSFTFVRASTKRWRAAKAETLRIASLISDRLPVAFAENMCLSVCAGLARTFGADRLGLGGRRHRSRGPTDVSEGAAFATEPTDTQRERQ